MDQDDCTALFGHDTVIGGPIVVRPASRSEHLAQQLRQITGGGRRRRLRSLTVPPRATMLTSRSPEIGCLIRPALTTDVWIELSGRLVQNREPPFACA